MEEIQRGRQITQIDTDECILFLQE